MHPEHRSIGELAYRLWLARGCPDGTAEQDWLEAEKQLKTTRPARPHSSEALDDSLKGTFPASDPPASHLPDVPPANAAAKWQAAESSRADTPRADVPRTDTPRAEPPRLDTSRVEVSRADSSPAETSRKSQPRRRSQAKSGQPASGSDAKPKSQSKPRNDSAS